MRARGLQIFFILLLLCAAVGAETKELTAGETYELVFEDVDGNEISTADGHVTIITVLTREKEEEAHAVADLVPDQYLGDPKYRYITLVNFQRKLFGPLQGLTRTIIRNRLNAEAKELKATYEAKNLTRDPRKDVYVIADFDGKAVTRLGLEVDSATLAVFIFNGEGKLVARWSEVPPDDSLPKALAASAPVSAANSTPAPAEE